jgi:hypothetical protein
MKPHDTKRQMTTQKNKNDIESWLIELPNFHIWKETQLVDG